MAINPRSSTLMCALCAVGLACDEPAFELAAPSLAETSLLTTGWKASGHPVVHGTPVQNVLDQRYSFIAISTDASSTAKGQVEVHYVRFTGQELTVHADVTCLSVVGQQAWVGAEITRLVVDGAEVPDRVGAPMIFRVVDVGEGEDATDLASLVSFPPVMLCTALRVRIFRSFARAQETFR
jgi:hypothetical protein